MSISIRTLILVALFAVQGCKAEKLTDRECREIREREIAFRNLLLKSEPVGREAVSKDFLEECTSGELYSRRDYECIINAESGSAMGLCMAQVHEEAR